MFVNPRRDRQARNFTTNVPKILDLKSSSEQIFFRKLSLGAPDKKNPVDHGTRDSPSIAVVRRATFDFTFVVRIVAYWNVWCWAGRSAAFNVSLIFDARCSFGACCDAMLGGQTPYSPSTGVTSLERERTATLIAFSGNHCNEIQLKKI